MNTDRADLEIELHEARAELAYRRRAVFRQKVWVDDLEHRLSAMAQPSLFPEIDDCGTCGNCPTCCVSTLEG